MPFNLSGALSSALAILLIVSMPHALFAQQAVRGPSLLIDGCDISKYPQITCAVVPVNPAGVPLANISKESIEVSDGGVNVPNITFTKSANSGAKISTSYMLVVDFGMLSRGNAVPLKDAAREVLRRVADNDRVALIGINGAVNRDLNAIDASKESGFVDVGARRNDIINLITQLQPVAQTPLYDAVVKAVTLTRPESRLGRRAVLVFSDGRDAKSTTYGPDDAINLARQNLIPIFSIAIGESVDDTYMSRLATTTDGAMVRSSASAADIANRFVEIQNTLKTQYDLTFTAPPASAIGSREIKIKLNTNSGNTEKTTNYTPPNVTAPPTVATTSVEIAFKSNGAVVNEKQLPRNAKVNVDVTVKGQTPARVEYIIDGQIVTVDKAPYTYEIQTSKYEAFGSRDIEVRVVLDPQKPDQNITRKITFAIAPPSVAIPTAPPTSTGIMSLLREYWLILVGLGLVLVGIMTVLALLLLRNRKPAASPGTVVIGKTSNSTVIGGTTDYRENANMTNIGGGTMVVKDVPGPTTGVWNEGAEGPKTMMYQPGKVAFEVVSGASKGLRYELGRPGEDTVTMGRNVVDGPASVKIKVESSFVSRQHARFVVDGDDVYIEDLNSSAGTKLNGQRINTRTLIKIGDVLEFADVKAEVKAI